VMERETADVFEQHIALAQGTVEPKAIANWLINEIFGRLNESKLSLAQSPVTPEGNVTILRAIATNEISSKMAKDILEIAWTTGRAPAEIIATDGFKQVTDTGAIEAAVDAIIAANPDKVAQAQAKPALLGWFVGQVMKQTGGKANPQAVNDVLKQKLGI